MKRWTVRILCWLALGAVMNVAVAWTSSLFARDLSAAGKGKWMQNPGPWPAPVPRHWSEPDTAVMLRSFWMDEYIGHSAAMHREPPGEPGKGPMFTLIIRRFGWPWRCMQMRYVHDKPNDDYRGSTSRVAGAVRTPWFDHTRDSIYLPMMPAWLGLVGDSCFYALPIALLWLAPGTIKRWHRRRKRLCIHCAYPVGNEAKPCPECGKGVRA